MLKMVSIILEWIFPVTCLGCKTGDKLCCEKCFKKIPMLNAYEKENNQSHLDYLLVMCEYSKAKVVKKLIHELKYKGNQKNTSETLLELLEKSTLPREFSENIQLIPVPLHKKRMRFRGFNQSQVIAECLKKITGAEINNNILRRVKNTRPQVKTNCKQKRKENMQDAFESETLNGGEFLVVDDVYTTGSTLEECARTLKKAGAQKVGAFVLAKKIIVREANMPE